MEDSLTEDTYHGENDKPDTQHLYVYCSELCGSSGHYAVALYTLVKIVAGGVVFYVSYSTWKDEESRHDMQQEY